MTPLVAVFAEEEKMTAAEWEECTDPRAMLELVRSRASERKLRLFACACCRRLWDQVNSALHRTVEVAEQYADGGVPLADLQAVEQAARQATGDYSASLHRQAFAQAASRYTSNGFWVALSAASNAAEAVASCSEGLLDEDGNELLVLGERAAQCRILRELFGNPFPRLEADSAWRTVEVLSLGQGVYEDRAFERLPVLADALEEAGCIEPAILEHLRGPGTHLRGCWALDLCLGKA